MNNYGFPSFCENNKDRIITAISLVSKSIPPKMTLPDYRFQISNLFCHALSKEFYLGGEGGSLRSAYSKGYDMIYADMFKISIKIQQEIFQKDMKNGKLTKPKEIVMKNCLGGNNQGKKDLELDFLMVIQRGKDKGGEKLYVGFGIVSKRKLFSVLHTRKNDQIIIKINNYDFDFYSGLYGVCGLNDQVRKSELNRIFSEGLSKTYDCILNA